ncbi:hypothetical protein FJ872_11180 [Mesorhizobium sp. B2-5-9]|uniref:Uncharacterized protein n=1 Tax=Mesorhizobium australicum (strain HAMBI 3006 / LMG 24608 / WSM2073) TaxID=754035 RepID=L0KM58_MESAW|nr:hypothetical protein Mesau_03383 [Mesorhizobium australicum WSM2073]TPK20273.1 hypothetical protein FJ872_11180 [Mesorhizobium sp. B2-5-9]TPK79770.1 hypothetical protein FJ527_06625 [Mesorhizobium sp. B2-4-18]
MAWYLNHYECYRCSEHWTDEWSCMCDDECPNCGARHATPIDSEDLTLQVLAEAGEFVVVRSPDTAEHSPDYEEAGRFASEALAKRFAQLGAN